MIVVIDTNVALTLFRRSHPNRPILDAWVEGRLHWAISTEILLEYEEVSTRMKGQAYAALIFRTLATVDLWKKNLRHIAPSFRFHLITHDPDDNKFADCAIAAEADFIITEDRHFQSLTGSGYKPQPVTPAEFIAAYL